MAAVEVLTTMPTMNRKHFMLSLAGVPAFAAEGQRKVNLPPPFATPSSNNRPQVIERPNGAKLQLPAGFTIEDYATGFEKPRYMVQDSAGHILLSDSSDNGTVYVLEKGDASKSRKLLTGLYRPFGMGFFGGYLYVAEPASIKRYKYDAKAATAGPGEEVVSLRGYDKGHWTRCVIFDQKAKKMYITCGSGSNVDAGEPRERASIMRFDPDGTGKEFIAEGTRNPVSIHLHPTTNELWTTVQERDLLGDDLVPDYFTSIKSGGFYGWPYAYTGPNEDPRRKGEKPDLVAKTIVPDVVLGAHVAAMDFHFYTGKMFPKQYQGGAFLALHGSWNRSKRVGYSVVYIPFKDGKPAGDPQDFLTGWLLDPNKREVWGRPVGFLQLPDGSLLLSDDDGGKKIWRISYKG
jgi:glucose/arabinose dehydrogenase